MALRKNLILRSARSGRLEGRREPAPGLRLLASPLLWVGTLFAALLVFMPKLAPAFHWAFPGVTPPVFARGSFFSLWLSHAGLVAAASIAATCLGVGLGVFVARPAGRRFPPVAGAPASVGQALPSPPG